MSTTIPEAEPVYQILVNGVPTGPYPLSEVIAGMQSGRFLPGQHAWTEGWPEWRPLSEAFPECVPVSVPTSSPPAVSDPPLLSALAYPFWGDGIIILITGTLFFTVLGVGTMMAPRGSLILGVFCAGYLLVTLQGIVQGSANGEHRMPSWPAFESSSWVADFLQPCFLLMATIALCLGPGYALIRFGAAAENTTQIGLGIALLTGGAVYLPMALLAVAMTDSVIGLDPRVVIPSIAAIPLKYLGILALLAGVLVVKTALQITVDQLQIGLLSTLINGFLSLYFAVVQARMLGLLYFTSRHRFRWT
jgi:hypothetical protein